MVYRDGMIHHKGDIEPIRAALQRSRVVALLGRRWYPVFTRGIVDTTLFARKGMSRGSPPHDQGAITCRFMASGDVGSGHGTAAARARVRAGRFRGA